MNNKSRIIVEYYITGIQLSPNEITDILGIIPSRKWMAGDAIHGTIMTRKEHGWCLSSCKNNDDIKDQIASLLKILTPKIKVISDICRRYSLESEFSCTISVVNNDYPAIHLANNTISAMCQLGAAVDVDIIPGQEIVV